MEGGFYLRNKDARMYPVVVAIDLETTGPDPYKDKVLEVGALVLRDSVPSETFSELANPGVPLPSGIVKLTGITPSMAAGARDIQEVMEDFLSFMPDGALCIAHNAAFDRAFLRTATKDRFRHVVMDTVELSRICFPSLPSHSLEVLSSQFGLPRDDSAHRALADCRTLAALWLKILERAKDIPLAAVGEMNMLLAGNPKHPYRDFFGRLSGELMSKGLGTETEFARLFRDFPLPPVREEADESIVPLPEDEVRGWFEPEGAFSLAHPGYELRQGQVEMAGTTARVINEGLHLLVEAGTGIGKSLAYLAPAVRYAIDNNRSVVVSTNTKNLQSQLFEKDLPLVGQALGLEFLSALLKGRRNYLCLRKLLYILRQSAHELDQEERMRMLNLLPWTAWTATGDISENIVAGRPGFAPLWAKLSTIGDECLNRGCPHYRRCFLWRARATAQTAHVVVANHSLVFADLNSKNPSLPPHDCLIFDEAHNLEDAATSHLSVELSQMRATIALSRLHRPGRKGASTGLLASVESSLGSGACQADDDLVDMARGLIADIRDGVDESMAAMEPFFLALETVLSSKKSGDSARFDAERKRTAVWEPVETARIGLFAAMAKALHGLEGLAGCLREMKKGDIPYHTEFMRDLDASAQWIREITEDAQFVLEGASGDYVYWIERCGSRAGGVRAWAAPVAVGELLHDQVYEKRRTVVFCSATMTVKGKFDFLARRLGIDLIEPQRLITLNAGTPFDYKSQCMVMTPMFLPEPGEAGGTYAKELAILLSEVFRRTDGRGMALFTSYDMLTTVADLMESELLGDGINLLAQGRSGSRESITSIFKRGNRSVLLGTHSFWEGVDVVGDALSCLVIARLPFAVQTDPIVEARCERTEKEGDNAFLKYSLPSAVIKFRQGFGRLIRSRRDRGVVILADRRVVAKRYGQMFRDSLPTSTDSYPDREEFLDAVEEFLSGH